MILFINNKIFVKKIKLVIVKFTNYVVKQYNHIYNFNYLVMNNTLIFLSILIIS